MFRLILLLFVVVIMTIPVVGQQDAKSNSAAPTTAGRKGLDEGRPSVYITFERFGVREPRGDDGDPNRIYLRLHNNSPWTVDFCISGLFDSTGRETRDADPFEIELNYQVERIPQYGIAEGTHAELAQLKDERVIPPSKGNPTTHGCSVYSLHSAESILFSVSQRDLTDLPKIGNRPDLADLLRIKIKFNYDWEIRRGVGGSTTGHYVYFSSSGLPKGRR